MIVNKVSQKCDINSDFLSYYKNAKEHLLVLDRHTDMYGLDTALQKNLDVMNFVQSNELYPVSLVTNDCGSVYLVDHSKTDKTRETVTHNGNSFAVENPPYIFHYGTNNNYRNGNWKFLERSELSELKPELNGCPIALHIDPDCFSEKAELEIIGDVRSWNDCINRGTFYQFKELPYNPFFNGGFGNVSFSDLKSVFDLELNELYIGEAFSWTHKLNGFKKHYIKAGQDILTWLATEFTKKLRCRTKAYIIDNGLDVNFKAQKQKLSVLKDIYDSISSLSEVVSIEHDWNADKTKKDLQTRFDIRDEILKQKNPIVVGRTHATAGLTLENSRLITV